MAAKVLLVDDEAPFLSALTAALGRRGYEVASAQDTRTAVSEAERFHPDVVVADWMLRNHADGVDLGRILRDRGIDARIIIMSGYPAPELKRRLEALPHARFLAKPFELPELIDMIDYSMDKE